MTHHRGNGQPDVPAVRGAISAFAEKGNKHCQNLGLFVDRLNPKIDPNNHKVKDERLKQITGFTPALEGYGDALTRIEKAVRASGPCEVFEIKATSRLLMGTGNASVFEFGCQLNQPWGVPCIPGSSLKGLLSSWLSREYGGPWKRGAGVEKSDAQVELFGGKRENASDDAHYSGSIVFHDAWLIPSVCPDNKSMTWFEGEIVNPHYPGYYSGTGMPTGMENPTPAKMAAIKPGTSFRVMVQGPEQYLGVVREEMLKALANEGIGGKTTLGYGRFALGDRRT